MPKISKKFFIFTYGCQMNINDSERIAGFLEKNNYKETKREDLADLVIINACSVRQRVVDRLYSRVRKYQKYRKKGAKILLTGCILESDKRRLKKYADLIFNINDLPILFDLLKNRKGKKKQKYFSIQPKYKSKVIAYIPIMTGCNNFCTYCVVPYTRGREYSRPPWEIIKEIKNALKTGHREIILLGQNVNSYFSQINVDQHEIKKINFSELLNIVEKIPGNFWLSFITSHPKDLSDELIEIMAKSKKIMPYLHLPIQSGSNEILKKMNRGYTVGYYKKLIKKVRQTFARFNKDICISTDIIVGFPGETRKQFEKTAKLMRELKFDMAYIAIYSPRPGTPAAKFIDKIDFQEKKRREKLLYKILERTALKNNKKYIGKIVDVIIESKKGDFYFGKTKTFKNIKIFTKKRIALGNFYKVEISSVKPWGLEGRLI